MRYFLLAPLTPAIGGVTIPSNELLIYLQLKGKVYTVDLTSKSYLTNLFKVIYYSFKADVTIFCATKNAAFILTIPLLFLKWITNSKLVMRKYGYGFFKKIESSSFSYIFKYILNLYDLICIETFDEYKKYSNYYKNCIVCTNSRNNNLIVKDIERDEKCIYVGAIAEDKGLDKAIKFCNLNNLHLDIYGPTTEYLHFLMDNYDGFSYHNIISPDDLRYVIPSYKYSILISSHIGEGYPGFLISSLMYGVPVLVNDWGALKDLTDNGRCGYVVDEETYIGNIKYNKNFKSNCINFFRSNFDSNYNYQNLVKEISLL